MGVSAHNYMTMISPGSQLWRKNGRCDGTGDKSAQVAGVTCDPEAWAPEKGPCCRSVADFGGFWRLACPRSKSGYCGNGTEHCGAGNVYKDYSEGDFYPIIHKN